MKSYSHKAQALIIVLMVMSVLAILVVSIGHRVSLALRLDKYEKENVKAYYLARAGLVKVISMIKADPTPDYDSLQEDWLTAGQEEGVFDNTGKFAYVVLDEERRINLNRVDRLGKKQLEQVLISIAGLSAAETRDLAEYCSVQIKGSPLNNKPELLVLLETFYKKRGRVDFREESRRIYDNLADAVTIDSRGKVNLNTATPGVIKIIFLSLLMVNPDNSITVEDVNNLSAKIVQFRKNMGFFIKLESGEIIDKLSSQAQGLTTGEKNLIFQLCSNGLVTAGSRFINITVSGFSKKIERNISATYDRQKNTFVYWHEK